VTASAPTDSCAAATQVAIAVRTLVEFLCRRGDLHVRHEALTEAREGIAVQSRLQRGRGTGYERERRVAGSFRSGGILLQLAGRIDGCDFSADMPVLEEFKTTRADPEAMLAHAGAVHWAQLRLYAALLALGGEAATTWQLRLIYCHPDTLATRVYECMASRGELVAFYEATCERFCAWLAAFRAHRQQRDRALAALQFPFPDFRQEQRTLARHAFRVARDGGALWAEAPTGIGKTLGTVYPSLKSMASAHIDRVLFLTSRGTGQAALHEAVRASVQPCRKGPNSTPLRTIAITARDKICFEPDAHCDPGLCRYARGYFDRRMDAIEALLAHGTMGRGVIESIGAAHQVCPFELSLDAAVWSDVVVCDYNYLFDPVVQLQRIRGMFADRTLVLIDEAHQLADRVRDMLSATLTRESVAALIASAAAPGVRSAAVALDRRLLGIRRATLGGRVARGQTYEEEVRDPTVLASAVETLLTRLLERSAADRGAEPAEAMFVLQRFQRALGAFQPDSWFALLAGTGPEFRLELRCLDAAAHMGDVLRQQHAVIGFSATLTPLKLFHRRHGIAEAQTLRVASPFRAEQLGVYIVRDIDARYRARSRSLDALVRLVADVTGARAGNYLVALPSFEYLARLADAFTQAYPGVPVLRQHPGMNEAEREAFVAAFRLRAGATVGFAVQGGVFTESVDLPGDALIGMVVVGVGLPPPSKERDRLAAYFRGSEGEEEEEGEDVGELAAYRQPAMTRVVQAAGRLIRSEQDRGVLCLVDDRFRQPLYRRFFPDFWRPRVVRASSIALQLDAFWNPG
jgi:DNA excision repair protein ERCC-2